MKLISLYLNNILSYKEVKILLGDLTAAWIGGKNGAGKTSIGDGILLAFFGECSRGKADIVKKGETEGTDELVFEVADRLYKIVRKFNISGRGKNIVELSAFNMDAGDWAEPKSGDEAKSAIIDLLGQSYESFTASTFLLQGNGEKFITLGPKKRFQVIFDILKLEKWGIRRADMVRLMNKLKGSNDELIKQSAEFESDFASKPSVEALIVSHRAKHAELTLELSTVTSDIERLLGEEGQIKNQVENLSANSARFAELVAQHTDIRTQIKENSYDPTANGISSEDFSAALSLYNEDSIQDAINQARVELKMLEGVLVKGKDLGETQSRRRERLTALTVELEKCRAVAILEVQVVAAEEEMHGYDAEIKALKDSLQALRALQEKLQGQINSALELERQISDLNVEIAKKEAVHNSKVVEAKHALETARQDFDRELAAIDTVISAKESARRESVVLADHAIETANQEMLQKLSGLDAVIARKESDHKALLVDAKHAVEVAKQAMARLSISVPCAGEGKYALCPHISGPVYDEAVSARNSLPGLEQALADTEKDPVISEKQEREAVQREGTERIAALEARRKELDELPEIPEKAHREAFIKDGEARMIRFEQGVAEAKKEPDIAEKIERDGRTVKLSAINKAQVQTELLKAVSDINVNHSKIATLEAEILNLKNLAERKPEVDLAKAQVERLTADFDALSKEIADAETELVDLRKRYATKPELEKSVTVYEAVQGYFAVKHRVEELSGKLADVEKEKEKVFALVLEGESAKQRLVVIAGDLEVKKRQLSTMNEGIQAETAKIAAFESEIKRLDKVAVRMVELDAEIGKNNKTLKLYEILADVYAKIPFYILDNVIPLIEEKANEVLMQISPSGLRIELATEKPTKTTGAVYDALDIIVSDLNGKGVIEGYSGGEKTRLILALTVGIAELGSQRTGNRTGVLLFDEPAGLDSDGMYTFAECLIKLADTKIVDQVFLMAHEEEMKSVFTQQILVEKVGTDSRVQVRY